MYPCHSEGFEEEGNVLAGSLTLDQLVFVKEESGGFHPLTAGGGMWGLLS